MTTTELVDLLVVQLQDRDEVATVDRIEDAELGVELADGGRFFVTVEAA